MTKIIASMMVYNDAPWLEASVPALQELCDSLIVQDNGSTDGSIGILEKLLSNKDTLILNQQGDRPDYSELRNHMLLLVNHGDWVLKWDPDELPSDAMHRDLLKYATDTATSAWSIPCYHIMKNPRECLPIEFGFGHVCFFQMKSGVEYRGTVHEQLYGLGKIGSISPSLGIAILHFSYYAEQRFKEKAKRYAKLPNSGFNKPEDLTDRLSLKTKQLPGHVTYKADPEWLEKMRTIK